MKVKKVVVLSTDKAAYPINAMGMSKALMEKIVIARSRDLQNETRCYVQLDMEMLWLLEALLSPYLLIKLNIIKT